MSSYVIRDALVTHIDTHGLLPPGLEANSPYFADYVLKAGISLRRLAA